MRKKTPEEVVNGIRLVVGVWGWGRECGGKKTIFAVARKTGAKGNFQAINRESRTKARNLIANYFIIFCNQKN